MILNPEDDGSLTVHFNGPTELMDIFLQTEAGEKFELRVSQDGIDYEPYTDEFGDVKVGRTVQNHKTYFWRFPNTAPPPQKNKGLPSVYVFRSTQGIILDIILLTPYHNFKLKNPFSELALGFFSEISGTCL